MIPTATAVTVARNVARRGVFSHFRLCVQVLLSLHFLTVCQGSRDKGSPARYGLSRMVLRFFPACHVLLGSLTFWYVPIKFCYVYQVLSRFSTMKRGRWMVFETQYAHNIKRRSTKLLQSLYYVPLIINIINHINDNEEDDFVFIQLLGAYIAFAAARRPPAAV